MFVLFILTAFATLLLLSLDGVADRRDQVWRRLRHGGLGLTSLAVGTSLAICILPTELQVPFINTSVAYADESETSESTQTNAETSDAQAIVEVSSEDTTANPEARDPLESKSDAAETTTASAESEPEGPLADEDPADEDPADEDPADEDPADEDPADEDPADSATTSSSSEEEKQPESATNAEANEPTEQTITTSSPTPADDFALEEKGKFPKVTIPYENRPQWVSIDQDLTGDIHRLPITAGPYVQKSECMKALDEEIDRVVEDYIEDYLDSPRATLFINYDVDEIKQRLLQEDHIYDETIEVSLGRMHQVHAMLEVNPEFRAELDQSWKDVQAGVRLSQTGLGAFGILGLLAVVFGYFKLDTATRGFYSTRLQILASLAILSLIAAGVLFYGWIPQL